MKTILGKLLVPPYTEYLAIANNLLIQEISSSVQKFADSPNQVMPGKDIRIGFPELIGYEDHIIDILEGRQNNFELKGIARFKENESPFYLDLHITSFENGLIVLLEDVTERMLLQQSILHNNHKMSLFLKQLTASRNYVDKILMSIVDALFVTTQSGDILTVNQAAVDLFEYSQEELIEQRISKLITDNNFLQQAQHPPFQRELQDYEVVCQTKTGKKLTVAFSRSVIQTEIEGLQNFVYIGRDITQRKRSERLQGLEHTMTSILASSTTLSEATTEILSAICSSLEWELGELWSVDRHTNVLSLSSNWHNKSVPLTEFNLVSGQITFSLGVGLPGRVWASGQPAWINDVVHDRNFLRSKSAAREDLHAAFGFPIKCGGEIKGVMTFFSREIQQPQSDLLTMMAAIGYQIGLFISRGEAETALRESEERFKAFMNNSPGVAFMKDSQGRYVYINKTLENNFNVKLASLQGKTDFDWLPEQTAKHVRENDLYVLSTGKTAQIIETVPTPDGCLHYWLTLKFPFTDSLGRQLVGGVAVDITDRLLLEQQLFEEKELALVTLQSIGDGVITTDAEGKIKYINPVAEQLTGWSLEDALALPSSEVFRVVNETTKEAVENPIEQALNSGCVVNLANDSILITRSGTEIAVEDSAAPIRASSGQIVGAVMVFQDVSQKRSMARQLSWQATHDALTGLFNRGEFEYRLDKALNSAKTENQQHALCYLDLDRFKIVNDTCGHVAGDELLRQVSTLFQAGVRSSDTLARLGGDEFAILLEGCPLEPAIRIANTLVQRLQEFRFIWQDKTFNIGVSIGLVVIDGHSQSMNSVLSAADTACYVAKNKGRNRLHIYEADDSELEGFQGIQWVQQITQALEENRFCLYYQPIVPSTPTSSNVEHYEVLLRLIDEKGGIVSPMAFIPAAERYNLMQAIDRWVIRTLFAKLGQQREKWTSCVGGNYNCLYAINLSGVSINDDQFMDFLREQLVLHQVPPQIICFEITETVAISNLKGAASLIHSLKELGCRFALDDFGSGMSSFSYLKNLPVDYLKIDGAFIKHIVEEPIDLAMVQAINQIGHVMGIQTIAEFVENEDILAKIKAIGVDYAQGYGIAKPSPLCFK